MLINISTSKANQAVVSKLTAKLTGNTKENVIARIAFGYSLASGKRFSKQEFNKYDSQGKEYKDHILFDASLRDFYIALVCQAYGISKTDENIPYPKERETFKMNINRRGWIAVFRKSIN